MHDKSPKELREMIRLGHLEAPTTGMALGYAQGNIVMVPKEYAYDFLLLAHRNPKPCPILYVSDPGERILTEIAEGGNIYTDVGRYRIYENGILVEEVTNVEKYYRDDLVTFVIGCSFTFEAELLKSDIKIPHIEENNNVSMYNTSIPLKTSGVFKGNVVVSMRGIDAKDVTKAVTITNKYSKVHGAPIHIGDPKAIGIEVLSKPDYGDYTEVKENQVPVFWACGVTPQNALTRSKIPFAITHAPGYMFLTDLKNKDLED